MDKQEFFLLIPAIIYGVAIVDLMKIFQHKKNYWEVVLWGVYLFVIIIFMWTEIYEKLNAFTADIKSFFLIIIQAILYSQAVKVITPEEKDVNTEQYFLENRRKFFLITAAIVVMNVVVQLLVFDDHRASWVRPTALVMVLLCAFYDNKWLRTSIWAFFTLVSVIIIFF